MERLLRGRLQRPVKLVYQRPQSGRRPKMVPPLKEEILPTEKTLDSSSSNVDISGVFKSITRCHFEIPQENPSSAIMVFEQLLETTKMLPPSCSDGPKEGVTRSTSLVEKVDALLYSFRNQSAPILPRVDMLNEAARTLIDLHENDKAIDLMTNMTKNYGVIPNSRTTELMASLQLRMGNLTEAIATITSLKSISSYGQEIINAAILTLFKRADDAAAWKLFDDLRAKVLPSPMVAATMITRCGKLGHVERAFLTYKQLSAQGMTPNTPCNSALIFAASKHKEYFSTAMDLYRQMDLLKMSIPLPVYNHLLYACGKVADLKTALTLWERVLTCVDGSLKPNEFTCCNFLWALASVETRENKLSKRSFIYDLRPEAILDTASQVKEYMDTHLIPLNAHSLSALLAIHSNLGHKKGAEEIFWKTLPEMNIARSPFAYELLFKLYDITRDYASAHKIHAQLQKDKIKIPCLKFEESLRHLEEMIAQDYKPHMDDFTTVALKLYEHDREDLAERLKSLCERRTCGPNPFVPWLQRSQAVARVLKFAYGQKAPEAATKIHKNRNK